MSRAIMFGQGRQFGFGDPEIMDFQGGDYSILNTPATVGSVSSPCGCKGGAGHDDLSGWVAENPILFAAITLGLGYWLSRRK